MRCMFFLVVLAALAFCGNASGQLANVPMPPMAGAKLPAQTQEKFNAIKSHTENLARSGSAQRALTDLRLAIDDPKNTPDLRSMLIVLNGQIAEASRDQDHAAALYQQASVVQGALPEVKVQAISLLAALRMKQSRPKDALDAFGTMLQIPGLPPDSRVVAMISRASIYQSMQENDAAYAELTAAAAVSEASPRHRATALLQGTGIPRSEPHWEEDIAQAMAIPDIPPDLRSAALLIRASFYRASRQKEKSLADCQTILSTPDTPANNRAAALAIIAEDQLSRYELDAALKGLVEALAQRGLQPDTQALAYLVRCKVRMDQNDYPRAYADLRLAERTDKISPAMQQQIRQQRVLMDGR